MDFSVILERFLTLVFEEFHHLLGANFLLANFEIDFGVAVSD